ncbi:MAG: transcriptional regulator with XRE-family HTH domain [Psychroserpens sp.]|jgi:transcriptional regulator with XRE-family HTH domain
MGYKALKAKLLSKWEGKAETSKMKFAFRITDLLKHNNMSNKHLADKLDTSNAYVTKILRGDQNFSIESMHKIADAVNADLSFHLSHKGTNFQWFGLHHNKKPIRPPAVKRVKFESTEAEFGSGSGSGYA